MKRFNVILFFGFVIFRSSVRGGVCPGTRSAKHALVFNHQSDRHHLDWQDPYLADGYRSMMTRAWTTDGLADNHNR